MQETVAARRTRAATAIIPVFALLAAAAPAAAQVSPLIPGTSTLLAPPPEESSVGQRIPAEYAALGGQVGDFLIYPAIDLQELYNDNVFVTETGKKSDFMTSLNPSVVAASNWNTNALNFVTTGQIRRWASEHTENENNFSAATNGRLDISNGVYLAGALGYEYNHEDRTSPDTVLNQEFPTAYQLVSGRLGYTHEAGKIGFDLNSGADYYSYDNNITSTGAPIVETDRDRIEYGLAPRVLYELTPGYQAFLQAPVNWRQYQSPVDAGGFKRDSWGYEVDAGTEFKITNLMNGEVYAGYLQQNYADSRLTSPRGVSFGGNVIWNPTQLDSVRLLLSRTIQETTVGTASSYADSEVGLTYEHELLRNVLLTASGGYGDQSYQGFARDDHLYTGAAGARYLINQYLSATASASYQTRLSSLGPNGYHQVTAIVGLHAQY